MFHTSTGLTSLLDSLLNTTSQAKLSECSPIPAKETDTHTDTQEPVSDQPPQKITASEHAQIKSPTASHSGDQPIPVPDSSHQEQVKDDSAHTSDTTDHSETKSERSHADSSPQTSGQTASINISTVTNEPHQIMLRCNDKLVTALSLDPEGIAGILLAKELIPENTEAQVRQCSTPREKATILVTTVRQRIKVAPKRFQEFLDILSKQEWTKDIMKVLQSCISHKQLRKDAGVQAVSTDDHDSTDKEQKSSSDISSNGEEHTFPELNSQDKAELEAQLILSADSMRKKFASLLVNVVNSLKRQGINPRELATTVLALTEYDDPAIGKPLLEREKEALMKAQLVDHTFDVLRPHMTFFNYEILEFLIEKIGSPSDKDDLQKFLHEFKGFCRRSVFEVPAKVLGHSAEKVVDQQKFCVKITKQFKVALLIQCQMKSELDLRTTSSTQLSSSADNKEGICAPELGISLEDAKHIQRKLASVLELKVSSIYLVSVSSGSTILTFLLPSHISLTGLDFDPDITALSSSGIHILCGPPGKPEPKELTSNGLVVQWSQPEYGLPSLAKYILYYQKKCNPPSEWQKLEISSLETHTCVPDLNDGDTYVFKICTVSDVRTLQHSDESDPIVISADGILTNNIHKVIVANKNTLISAFSSADPNTIAVMLSIKGVISKEDEAQVSLASTPSEKATLLITAIENQVKSNPQKFQDFLNALSDAKFSLCGDDYFTREEGGVLMVFLLLCLFEAQDPSLCESVAQQLQYGLDLRDTTLTPSDCLCIGYFLAHVCKMAAGEFEVNLRSCSIGDQGCKYLVSGLHKYLDTHSVVTTLLNMDMEHNAISHHGVYHLSTLLKIGCINVLNLNYNDLVSKQDAICRTLAKQLKNNTTLKQLWLSGCGLNSQSVESLAEALTTNKHLEGLDVSDNALCDDGIQYLAHALRVNQGLKDLDLWNCCMTDVGLECLAKSLQHNNVLTKLYVFNVSGVNNPNRLTEKIVPVLTECLQNNHTLTELELPWNLMLSTASIVKAVNNIRKRSGLSLFKVTGMSVTLNENSM